MQKTQSVVQHRKSLATSAWWHNTFLELSVFNYAYSKLWIFNKLAECHLTLSSWVGSGHKTNKVLVWNLANSTKLLLSASFYGISQVVMTYRIVLNFRGSKFSWIAVFEDFVEIISRTRCMRTPHAACQKCSLKYFRERLKIHEIL